MNHRNLLLGCAVTLSTIAARSFADPSVSAPPGQIDNVSVMPSAGAWVISFRAIGSANSNVMVTAASNEPISSISVETNENAAFRVNLTVTAPSVASVSKSDGDGEFWVTSITTTTGDIGHVTADIIGTLDAGADLSGDIVSTRTTIGISEDGIGTLVAGGSIFGSITSHRRIGTISAPNGIIGVPGTTPTPIEIEMTSAAGLQQVTAKSVYANIDLNSGTGELNALITTGTGAGGFTGEFTGSLECSKITGFGFTYGLDVKGDLDAENDHTANDMATNFRIGGSLLGDILLPEEGLTKQIIIRGNGTSGSWTGAVKIDGVAIDHTGGVYEDHQDELGGGAVGLSPFRFHAEGCDPPNGDSIPQYFYDPTWIGEGDPPCESRNDFTTVVIRHLGPVREKGTLPRGTDAIYRIWATFVGCDGDFPCAGSFEVTDEFDIVAGGDDGREITITRDAGYNGGKWDPGYEYYIEVQQSEGDETTLESVDVVGFPQVPYYIYWIALPACPESLDMLFDQDGDGELRAADLNAWPGVNADVSRDGAVTAFDLYKLICGHIQREALR